MSEVLVSSIWRYPLTGGPGVSMNEWSILPGGLAHDRTLLLAEETPEGLRRIGSKQAPDLLKIRYQNHGTVALLDSIEVELPLEQPFGENRVDGFCDEFGDNTPIVFMDKMYDDVFTKFLDRKVRLLRKSVKWQFGHEIPPEERANAPLHIIGESSVEDIAVKNKSSQDIRRYKPNIVLGGLDAHDELRLIGKVLEISNKTGTSQIQIDRGTPRCPVPSFNPDTGEDLRDLSLRTMPKSANRNGKEVASAGVYAHLIGTHGRISVGDTITIL